MSSPQVWLGVAGNLFKFTWRPGAHWHGCHPHPIKFPIFPSTAAAAKSLQSCPTLCDPIDGSPPGSPIPGILQARTLEWVAISFSNAGKWEVKVKPFSRVRLLATPWTAAYQAPPPMGFARQEYWSGVPLPSLFPSTMTPQTQTKKHARSSRAPPLIKQAGLLPAHEVDSSAKLSVPPVWGSSGVQTRPQSQALPMSRRGWLLRKLKLRNFRVRWSRGPASALRSKLLSVSWLYSGSQVYLKNLKYKFKNLGRAREGYKHCKFLIYKVVFKKTC